MTAPEIPRYHWFGKPTVEKLTAALNQGSVERIEIHGEGHDMQIHVIHFGEAVATSDNILNVSFPCPPVCP